MQSQERVPNVYITTLVWCIFYTLPNMSFLDLCINIAVEGSKSFEKVIGLQKYKTRSDDQFLILFVSFNPGKTVVATTSLLKNYVKSENGDVLFVKWLNVLKSLSDAIWFRLFRIVFNYNDAVNHSNDINEFNDVLDKFTIFKTTCSPNRLVSQWFILYISSIVCLISNPRTHFGFLLPSQLYHIFAFIWIKQMP